MVLSIGHQLDLDRFVRHIHKLRVAEVVFRLEGLVVSRAGIPTKPCRGIFIGPISDIVGSQRIVFFKVSASLLRTDEKIFRILGITCHPKAVQIADAVVRTAFLHHRGVVGDADGA